ncbi:uncharacterized protein L969DRAFT_50877 [Mixia osmundae IAM 14324]|uniref:Tyrosine-protein phosphatase domain-containing protein n=1 Tax=Mixia osmundae (strain CBS 9802 / IAM 14324 / JCM 22182 / KY 12970) TaxID=764103 RepID=G7E0H3_MIXOS|nr:uncharacterized protein L969DRAFT_50877 [Mixia osmundae IAM 14324]KEI38342.1 hypothetical protein L969DRAFT_50877 [Mixia osmundae IAM 14324]GAA96333.1 hypothetical protein E5Q_02999 [Mixia osmundae IAM 14324]
MALAVPVHFQEVHTDLYRSSAILPAHLNFIRTLKLKTLVILSPEQTSKPLCTFCEQEQVEIVSLGLQSILPGLGGVTLGQTASWRPFSDELMKDAIELALDRDRYPIMLMDSSGIHVTGVMFAILRKLEHWSFSAAIAEYISFAASKARFQAEQYVELFDTSLIAIPQNPPQWYADMEDSLT